MSRRVYFMLSNDSVYQRDIKAITKILNAPPKTWAVYAADPNKYQKVIDMEHAELEECRVSGNYACYVENLLHVAAAYIAAHHAMTCKEYD